MRSSSLAAALFFAALPIVACAPSVTYVATPRAGMANGVQSPDPLVATRASAVLDIPCPADSLSVYRLDRGHGPPTATGDPHGVVYLDVAEGCGKRATYVEECGADVPLAPGTTNEGARHRREWTVDDPTEHVSVCRMVLVGKVAIGGPT